MRTLEKHQNPNAQGSQWNLQCNVAEIRELFETGDATSGLPPTFCTNYSLMSMNVKERRLYIFTDRGLHTYWRGVRY